MRFFINGRARGVRFLLDFSITCFWPQTDKVSLFLAAAQQIMFIRRESRGRTRGNNTRATRGFKVLEQEIGCKTAPADSTAWGKALVNLLRS